MTDPVLPAAAPVLLVTGASRGIGAACAVRAAHAGWDVAVNYTRDARAAQQVAEQVRAAGRRALVVQADVGRAQDIAALSPPWTPGSGA